MKCSPCPLCLCRCTGHRRRRITVGLVDADCTHGLPRMGVHEWTTLWKQPHSSDAESGSAPIGATSEEASGSTCTQSSDDAQDGGARYDPGDLGDPHGPWRLCCLCSRLVGDDTDSHGVAVMDLSTARTPCIGSAPSAEADADGPASIGAKSREGAKGLAVWSWR